MKKKTINLHNLIKSIIFAPIKELKNTKYIVSICKI